MEQPPITTEPFRVRDWRVEPTLNRIAGPGGVVQLEPRVMDVLCCLAAHAGTVVPREALLETVWAGVVVGDDPLNRAVSTLRKLFGDDPRQPAYIETIRKVGYRLIAPVERAPAEQAPVSRRPAARAPVAPRATPGGDGAVAEAALPARWRRWIAWGAAALALAAVGALAIVWGDAGRTGAPALRPIPLTSLPGREVDPALSPDGSRVAYAWDGGGRRDFDLFVRTVAEAPPLRLTEGPAEDRSPAWSPDGQSIAFIRREGDACAVLAVPALGGRARHLAACTDAEGLAWGAGGHLAFADRAGPEAPFRLVVLDPGAAAPRPLTAPPPAAVGDRYPAFSPDGSRVAFVRSAVAGLDRLHAVAVSGGTPAPLSSEPQRIRHVAWPEAGALIYASDWGGAFGLYRRALDGGAPQWLVGGGDGVHHPTVRGARTVYEEWAWDKNVWAAPLDGGAPEPLITSTRWDHSPHVAPDGRVAFVSNRSGSYELWLWAGGRAEALTRFGGPVLARPQWAPDGRRIAFDVRAEGRADVYVLDLDGGPPRRVTDGAAHALHAAWSPDGAGLYYASDRSGAWEIWRTAADGGAPERVTDAGGYVPAVGPDGRWLYYAKAGQDGLWRRPLPAGPEQRVTGALRAADHRNWTPTPDGLLLVTRGPEAERDHEAAARLSRLDPETGLTTVIGPLPRPVANLGLAVSPDGRRVLYVQVDQIDTDLMTVLAE